MCYLLLLSQIMKNTKEMFFYRGALVWNALPVIERNIDTYDKFKGVQKKKMIELHEGGILGNE